MTDTTSHLTPEQEHALYADPVNQEPQGPGVRRRSKLSAPLPVRFPKDVLQQLRDRAADDDSRRDIALAPAPRTRLGLAVARAGTLTAPPV